MEGRGRELSNENKRTVNLAEVNNAPVMWLNSAASNWVVNLGWLGHEEVHGRSLAIRPRHKS